jgi:hypothetical protein
MEPMWQVPARVRLELLALLSADATKPATMTYDEFIAWVDEDTLAEWADGRVVMASPASARHQYLAWIIHEHFCLISSATFSCVFILLGH